MRRPRFEDLTETTGTPIAEEGASMMYTRYSLAARFASRKRVLEIGCGAGQGLAMIDASAARVIGGDYSMALLRAAQGHSRDRLPLVRLSGEHLPLAEETFDLIVCFEASYYVPNMAHGFREIVRVLRPGGVVLFANANPERQDFIRSPHSTHYHSADEFRAALAGLGLQVEVHGAFPVESGARDGRSRIREKAVGLVRRGLEALHLVPRTLRGRARLKRLIYGRLRKIPAVLAEGFAAEAPLTPLPVGPAREHKVLYVIATKPAS